MLSPLSTRAAALSLLLSASAPAVFTAAALDCSNNKDNGVVYNTTDASYDIMCGVDYAGGDLATQAVTSFEECISLCDATARCVDVSYVPSRKLCYMKSNLETPVPNGDIWTARNRVYGTETYLTCDNNHSNGTIYDTTNGYSYQILCNVDYAGGDLAASSQSSFVACLELCDNTPGCIDVSYVQPSCYLKSVLNTPVSAGNVWTGKRVKKVVSSSSSSLSPSTLQTIVATSRSSSISSSVSSSTESTTSSFSSSEVVSSSVSSVPESTTSSLSSSEIVNSLTTTSSLSSGISSSASTEASSSATLSTSQTSSLELSSSAPEPSSTLQTSSLPKSSVASTDSSSSSSEVPNSSLSSSESSSRSTTAASEASSSTYSSESFSSSVSESADLSSSVTYTSEPESSSSVGSLSSSESSFFTGSITSSYSSFVTVSATGSTASSLFTATLTSSTASASPTQTAPSCINGESDKTNFTTTTGSIYSINCGYENYGGDLIAAYAATFQGCMSQCDSTTGCVGVSYVGTTCYMKQRANGLVVSPNAWSATRLRNSTSTSLELSCFHEKTNGTVFETIQGNYYEILCNMDIPGGDFAAVQTDTFEDCLNKCDTSFGCIDVAYVAPSCYLKKTESTPVKAQNVWGARAVESPAPTVCASGGVDLYPVANKDVDSSSIESLAPERNATLNYAEKYPGTNAVSLYLNMLYPQVSLENSGLVSVACSNSSLTVTADSEATRDYIMSHWPSSGLVFFTNSEDCNTAQSRGIYLTSSALATMGSLSITFGVSQKNFTDVASDVTIKYGTITYTADDIAAAAAPEYTSTCSETGSLTAAPTPTATASDAPTSTLDAGAQKFYELLAALVQYDEDGNLIGHPANTQNVTMDVTPFDPTNTTAQDALEDMLESMGLDPPASLAEKASNGAKGVCYAPTKTSDTLVTRKRSSNSLAKRLSWDDITKYACDDTIGDLVGAVNDDAGDLLEGACAANDLYENRDAISCLWKGGCYTTTTIITYYTPPPATKYTFDYSWSVNFPAIKQPVVYAGLNKQVSCVNCGFSISNIEFSGEIIINMTAGVIQKAEITSGISGVANMIAGLKSDSAWSGNWSYIYSTTNLGSISIDSAFNIVPTVLYGIGINYNTDSAVDTSGGAQFSLNNAVATMNLLTGDVLSQSNWNPSISFTNPAFSTGSNIQLQPYMRWGINLEVSIYGQVALSPSIASQTVVGLDSQYSFAAQGSCPANRLAVSSYVSTKNLISNGKGVTKSLYTNQQYNAEKCYDVPSNQPAPSDIVALSESGQAFCTSYINYKAPTALYYTTSTTVVPSKTTVDSTTVITSTPIITIYPTSTITTYWTQTVKSTTVWVTATNGATMREALIKRGAEPTGFAGGNETRVHESLGLLYADPLETTAPTSRAVEERNGLVRRATTPALVSGWPASKISYACSQIATGSTTVTSTVLSTSTSGVVTATRTITANERGPLSTSTRMFTTYAYEGYTTKTIDGTATSTTYSCPLQTQVSSCITITGHGPQHIDGVQLRYASGYGNPVFWPSPGGNIWYLSCNGTLTSFSSPNPMAMSGYPSAGTWLMMMPDWYLSANNIPLMTCTKDTATKALNCDLGGWTEWWVLPPTYISNYMASQGEFDDRVAVPYWGPDDNVNDHGSPISLTYDEVECPCDYSTFTWGRY